MASSRLEDIIKLLSSEAIDSDGVEYILPTSPTSSEDNNDSDSDSIRTVKQSRNRNSEGDHESPTESADHPKSRSPFLRSSAASSSRLSVASYSTWSTNMTMSNLVGAGRTLGNLYSSAGRRLEKGVLQLLARTGRGPDACADRLLGLCQSFFAGWPFRELPEKSRLKGREGMHSGEMRERLLLEAMGPDCERLLRYGAATNLPDIQLMAFRRILDLVTRCPLMRRAFKACCESRNLLVDIEAVMFHWKKSESDLDVSSYSYEWLLYYRLATLCLGKNDVTAVVDELAFLSWSKDRSEPLAALIELCLASGDLGELAKGFLIGYILDYDVPRSANPIGLFIRFWEDMLELDQSAHNNLVKIFEQMEACGDDFDSDACAKTQELANVLLRAFRKDIHYHIRYAHKSKDVRAFLTAWKIINLECIRRYAL
ncbi:hypothetical protein SCHPADRAFT_535649 [Schizopora paradoxa]|uniref:Uncharacterized protein n=1 Tax=Schizopora paradoxa TaxID=27342 RepID=A0A0H2REV9_9AGAM|nr:hypothetical protein SCHPADRAFT_535649 [Schizopora paradoxa]